MLCCNRLQVLWLHYTKFFELVNRFSRVCNVLHALCKFLHIPQLSQIFLPLLSSLLCVLPEDGEGLPIHCLSGKSTFFGVSAGSVDSLFASVLHFLHLTGQTFSVKIIKSLERRAGAVPAEKHMNKVAVVTGSSRGIGFATARQLCLDGYDLVMVATGPREKNAGAIARLEALGTGVHYVQADISNHDDRLRIVEEAVAAFGRIDVLVNNAGVAPRERADLLTMTEESFDRVVGTNTKGNMFLTQAVARQMIRQEPVNGRRGVIVNISSCSAVVSSINRGEYCVSKAGVSMLTTLYADRLAPEGILVHEIRPGVIDTDMTGAVHEKYDRLLAAGEFPIARWGQPQDIADAVSLLVSEKLRYTTGNYIDVDGGFHIRRL